MMGQEKDRTVYLPVYFPRAFSSGEWGSWRWGAYALPKGDPSLPSCTFSVYLTSSGDFGTAQEAMEDAQRAFDALGLVVAPPSGYPATSLEQRR